MFNVCPLELIFSVTGSMLQCFSHCFSLKDVGMWNVIVERQVYVTNGLLTHLALQCGLKIGNIVVMP